MMDIQEDTNGSRLIGDYVVGPRIGSGSFAVVWRATHRQSGKQFAVKEIDRKQLSPVVGDNLFKEISILNTIRHPNIIRLFEAIPTLDRIFLIMEYCDGGDLAAYIHRHGKVSEAVARHFMRQLAAGLQVLNEKHLIHRDLKPQNLLLSTNGTTPLLKIGDFGFARYLKPQGLADTLCGSPLYMAPEIIQNRKYDAKADLWSVGAILFQLVTGKPPFDGNTQLQLFQNILTSSELVFPKGALQELHPDCVDLCRSLLRQNPVERLSFKEFFTHKFLLEPNLQFECLKDQTLPNALNERPQLQPEHPLNSSDRNSKLTCSSIHDSSNNILHQRDHESTSSIKTAHELTPNTACNELGRSGGGVLKSSSRLRVSDSMESIEKDYVLVSANFASMGSFCSSTETSLQESSSARVSICPLITNKLAISVGSQRNEVISGSIGEAGRLASPGSDPLKGSCESTIFRETKGLSMKHPSIGLQLLHQYTVTLSELAQEKFNAGLFLESFSVELVVLAIWKEVLRVCSSWMASNSENDTRGSCSANESTCPLNDAGLSSNLEGTIDFSRQSSVSMWAEQGFISAFDRADKLSDYFQKMDGNAEMPDAMEIIFQTALAAGRSGAVDEYMENKHMAAASYVKAKLLLSFILEEATSLPLNPPFSLAPAVRRQIQRYIVNLESHLLRLQSS